MGFSMLALTYDHFRAVWNALEMLYLTDVVNVNCRCLWDWQQSGLMHFCLQSRKFTPTRAVTLASATMQQLTSHRRVKSI